MTDKTPKYFIMCCDDLTPAALIEDSPSLPSSPWLNGRPVSGEVPNPLVYTLDPDYPGHLQPLYEAESIPLMRDDLLEALHEVGVDNLELFPAVIRDEEKGVDYNNYKAFNIVGLVSCADMDESKLMGTSDSTMIDIDFEALVIDESRTGGALMFRLAEAVNAIVVHEKVRKHIEERGIPGMTFYGPGEWAG